MSNMDVYNAVRECPQEAQKKITGGRINGFTDINPQWRIETLTKIYGPVGIGWYYTIERQWLETGANGEIAAFCNISLYIKDTGEWSAPIQGTGGSMFIANEKSGARTSDECFKMALTDALSVACKALGVGANIYWNNSPTKYTAMQEQAAKPKAKPAQAAQPAPAEKSADPLIDADTGRTIIAECDKRGINLMALLKLYKVMELQELKVKQAQHIFANWETLTQKCSGM
jgi:hypothetical protein